MKIRICAIMICVLIVLGGCNFPEESTPGAVEIEAGDSAAQDLPAHEGGEAGEALVTDDDAIITYVDSPGIGNIVVRIQPPETPRYSEGAPIVVEAQTFFTPSSGFNSSLDATIIGAISVDYLWPGNEDPRNGVRSDGEYDYGGENCLAALRDVIRFATGETTDVNGYSIDDLLEVDALTDNVGLYAFSHPGIAATNVIAHYGALFPGLDYFVGRENPTEDAMYALEPGHFDETGKPLINPYYDPMAYTPTAIRIDYSQVGWLQNADYPEGWPYFAVADGQDYVVSSRHPTMFGKDFFSIQLLQALVDNGALALEDWPENLATPQEARDLWPYRTTVENYPLLRDSAPNLKVILVFAREDHVQTAIDKPHIHQAYDGFRDGAGLWVRLNPDAAYVQVLMGLADAAAYTENPANSEPGDWMQIRSWGYRGVLGGQPANVFVPLAAVSEMMDRVQFENWDADLASTLYEWTLPDQ
jgi:hypothetical protein